MLRIIACMLKITKNTSLGAMFYNILYFMLLKMTFLNKTKK